jgi:uncharacterized membrane protein
VGERAKGIFPSIDALDLRPHAGLALREATHGQRMFTPPGYGKRLRADVERWSAAGLIDRAAADTIIAETKTDSAHAIVTVLAFVFAILAAGGLIALVAANWNDIPREIRVAGLLALNLVVLAVCLVFSLQRKTGSIAIESSAALSVMSAAASISLIGQIYHFPSNWPGFCLAMMCIAGATALIARSTACLWLAAVAQVAWHVANRSDKLYVMYAGIGSEIAWTQEDWIFVAFSAVLIGTAISRWTARSGPWTILVAVLPLVWWMDNIDFFPLATGGSLAWLACGIVAAVALAHERLVAERSEAAASALIGLFAIGIAAFALPGFMRASALSLSGFGLSGAMALAAVGTAAALAVAAAVRPYTDRAAVLCLAAALAAPFVANRVVLFEPRHASNLGAIIRLVLIVLLPLALLAVEARLSDRRKTFAFAIAAVIAVVCYQVWASNDLLSLAWVFLGGSAVLGAVIVISRALTARTRQSGEAAR